jgi:integrase
LFMRLGSRSEENQSRRFYSPERRLSSPKRLCSTKSDRLLDVRPGQLQIAADSWRSQSTAARAVAFFRPLAAWGLKRELLVKGFSDLEMPALAGDGEEIGQHVLSRQEVAKLLCTLGENGHDGAARFMLLTAARREEVVGAVWAEIDLKNRTWTIPALRRKDTRAPSRRRRRAAPDHVVPLSRQARALLETLGPQNATDLIFVGGRGAKLANWPRWSAQIQKEDWRGGDAAHVPPNYSDFCG